MKFDWVLSPVGFGCNFVGNWKGFEDLLRLGLISRLPRLAAVQSEGSPSLVRAFELGLDEGVPGPQETIAGGISQVVPPNSILALKAIRGSEGTAIAITDEEMLSVDSPSGAEGRKVRGAGRRGCSGGVEEDGSKRSRDEE